MTNCHVVASLALVKCPTRYTYMHGVKALTKYLDIVGHSKNSTSVKKKKKRCHKFLFLLEDALKEIGVASPLNH